MTTRIDVSTFISCRRGETTTLHNVIQGISLPNVAWLQGALGGSKSQSGDIKGREVFNELLYWIFEYFVLPLLKVSCK